MIKYSVLFLLWLFATVANAADPWDTFTISWQPVTTDLDGGPETPSNYNVWTSKAVDGSAIDYTKQVDSKTLSITVADLALKFPTATSITLCAQVQAVGYGETTLRNSDLSTPARCTTHTKPVKPTPQLSPPAGVVVK